MAHRPSDLSPHYAPSAGIIAGLMLALLAWGTYLALGGYQAAVQQHTAAPLLRSLVIFACTVFFLAFWGAMLWFRHRRP
jgi:hypothetical protein